MNVQKRIREIEIEIEKLPQGNIVYKNIRGAKRMYLRWSENGERKEKYIKASDEKKFDEVVSKRKLLEEEYKRLIYYANDLAKNGYGMKHTPWQETGGYETNVILGEDLAVMGDAVKSYEKRECMGELMDYLENDEPGKVCVIYGLRRTGKTTMVLQAINSLPIEKTAYIKIMGSDGMDMLNRDLRKLQGSGYKYIFIDEVTLMEDFIDSASLISDIYAMRGLRIVLSGTDSLGFAISSYEELYDRCVNIHTTFIPFREYSHLLGIHDIDEYIRYGGTFKVGEIAFSDKVFQDESISFRDDESTRRYIDTAIARNIQHSLACYKDGGHFKHLQDLYEADELTNAVNRIIEDMNHRFLISVIDNDTVTARLMDILDIKNKGDVTVTITHDHIYEIKEYLKMLDLILDVPTEEIGGKLSLENILFSQPGMRYCQARALVHSLARDEVFKQYPIATRKEICNLILDEVKGRMLEDIVLLETVKTLDKGRRGFKLLFNVGEFDMVIANEDDLTCEVYEIKHSNKTDKEQTKYLLNEEICKKTEFEYGTITKKAVIYRGENQIVNDIEYINVVEYLETLSPYKN